MTNKELFREAYKAARRVGLNTDAAARRVVERCTGAARAQDGYVNKTDRECRKVIREEIQK